MIILCSYSCQKSELSDNESITENQEIKNNDDIIKLGDQLKNPYSVYNMHEALTNLQNNNQLKSALTIETTHYYVRFLPASEQELEMLKREGLELYEYPLDYELVENGVYYHDPSIPVGQITWQYTTVPVNYEFSEIKYEIIENLYLQEEVDDETGNTQLKTASIVYLDWIKLENEALRITGNLGTEKISSNTLKASKWNPSGTIQVWDNVMKKYIPVYGARVRARRWFTTKSDITDSNGYFRTGSFRRDVNYSIKWERDDFDIRSGSYGQAYYNGPKMRGEWNLKIQSIYTPKSFLYAHIHRAAITYFYENWVWGIKSPPTRDGIFKFLQQRLHIGGKDEFGRSHYFAFNSFIQSAQVVIYSNNYDSRNIFGSTIHELAHTSHWEIGYTTARYVLDWLTSHPKLPESWAVGVEWNITNDVYRGFGPYLDHIQFTKISDIDDLKGYTPLVIDLIDNVNQSKIEGNLYPNDQVEGYTLSQIESALPGSLGSWWTWRKKILENSYNPTKEHVDYLIQTYN